MRKTIAVIVATWLGMTAAHAVAAGDLPTHEIVVRDGRFMPPRIEVPAGQRIKLVIANQGTGPLEFENIDMRIEKVVSAGARSFVVLPKLRPGEYTFIDEFNPSSGRLVVIAQ